MAFASAGMWLFPGKTVAACVGPAGSRVGLCCLRLGAARPIEPVIEADDDRVEIGAYADRGNGVEIVVLAAEVVKVIFDLA